MDFCEGENRQIGQTYSCALHSLGLGRWNVARLVQLRRAVLARFTTDGAAELLHGNGNARNTAELSQGIETESLFHFACCIPKQ
jgi:hypothetical protein